MRGPLGDMELAWGNYSTSESCGDWKMEDLSVAMTSLTLHVTKLQYELDGTNTACEEVIV